MAQATSDRLHLLCAADAAYGAWTGVMLSSILAQDNGRPLHIHLLSDGVASRDLRRMAAMTAKAGAILSCYDVRPALETLGPTRSRSLPYLTRAATARLFFERFLELPTGKLLYCDSDIVCVRSLRDLFAVDLGDAIIGAVPNGMTPGGESGAHNHLLGLPTEHPYANSGVLLIDVARWREEDIGRRTVEYITGHGTRLPIPDQDALNAVLGARIKPLPPWWNFQIDGFPLTQQEPIALIHFAGPVKPWFAGYRRAFAAEFQHAKRNSPWRYTPSVIPSGRILHRWRRSIGKRLPLRVQRSRVAN